MSDFILYKIAFHTYRCTHTGVYGKAEFIFAQVLYDPYSKPCRMHSYIKVITITVLFIVLDLGCKLFDGIPGSKGRFLGFWAILMQAAFSFIGTEIVAVSTFYIPL